MKAQTAKNSVIVPVGAKGGFVVKRGDGRSSCRYRAFIRGMLDLTDNLVDGKVVATAGRRAPRRRRPLPRCRGRQGHRHVLRHRQRDRRGVRLLAGRRVRVGRVVGLRPQGDGHHRTRCVGVGARPFPRDGRRRRHRRAHGRRDRRHVGRRVRQRACCARSTSSSSRRSTTATCSSTPIPTRRELRRAPPPLRSSRRSRTARRGPTTTPR